MKNLNLIFIFLLCLSCPPDQGAPLCEYQAQGATNYVADILTEGDTLSNHPGFSFPYTSPFLEDLQFHLTNFTDNPATVTVDASRNITITVTSDIVFEQVIFSNNLDGSQPIAVAFDQNCE